MAKRGMTLGGVRLLRCPGCGKRPGPGGTFHSKKYGGVECVNCRWSANYTSRDESVREWNRSSRARWGNAA